MGQGSPAAKAVGQQAVEAILATPAPTQPVGYSPAPPVPVIGSKNFLSIDSQKKCDTVYIKAEPMTRFCPHNQDKDILGWIGVREAVCIPKCDGFIDCTTKWASNWNSQLWTCTNGNYKVQGPLCTEKCPSGMTDLGVTCVKINPSGKWCNTESVEQQIVKFAKSFRVGYYNEIISFALHIYNTWRPDKFTENTIKNMRGYEFFELIYRENVITQVKNFVKLMNSENARRRRLQSQGQNTVWWNTIAIEWTVFAAFLGGRQYGFGAVYNEEENLMQWYAFVGQYVVTDIEMGVEVALVFWKDKSKVPGVSFETSIGIDLASGASVGGEATFIFEDKTLFKSMPIPNVVDAELTGFELAVAGSSGINVVDASASRTKTIWIQDPVTFVQGIESEDVLRHIPNIFKAPAHYATS